MNRVYFRILAIRVKEIFVENVQNPADSLGGVVVCVVVVLGSVNLVVEIELLNHLHKYIVSGCRLYPDTSSPVFGAFISRHHEFNHAVIRVTVFYCQPIGDGADFIFDIAVYTKSQATAFGTYFQKVG